MQDPTRDEMLECLSKYAFISEFDNFDIEEAIYWYASDWHGGQSSNLYKALCTSPYKPGPIANKPSETAQILYEELETEFS